jgi:drug/metabolite transporter (DMT)-like permease
VVIVGFIGVLIVLRPGLVEVNPASVMILMGALIWASTVMVIRSLTRTESAEAIVAYMFIVATPFSLVAAVFVWQTPSLEVLLLMVVLSGFGVGGHLCVTRAFAAAETTFVMPFEYVRMPMFALVGLVFYGEVPDLWTLMGSAVIIGCAIYMGQREATLARAGR